jgi:hypothetical protein
MNSPLVTDWIQAIVSIAGFLLSSFSLIISAIGLVYIIKTLRAQNEINRMQNETNIAQLKILKIESDRAAREIKPEIDVIKVSINRDKLIPHAPFVIVYKVRCERNIAFRVCFEYLSISADVQELSRNMGLAKVVSHKLKEGHCVEFTVYEAEFHGAGGITIRVHFLDADNQKFYEDFICEKGIVTYGSDFSQPSPERGVNGNICANDVSYMPRVR